MVATKPDQSTRGGTAERPPHALVQALFRRIDTEAAESRFLKTDPCGREAFSPFGLALLVAEIVTEHTADLVRERDEARAELAAANDAVLELMHQRDAALARAVSDTDGVSRA